MRATGGREKRIVERQREKNLSRKGRGVSRVSISGGRAKREAVGAFCVNFYKALSFKLVIVNLLD